MKFSGRLMALIVVFSLAIGSFSVNIQAFFGVKKQQNIHGFTDKIIDNIKNLKRIISKKNMKYIISGGLVGGVASGLVVYLLFILLLERRAKKRQNNVVFSLKRNEEAIKVDVNTWIDDKKQSSEKYQKLLENNLVNPILNEDEKLRKSLPLHLATFDGCKDAVESRIKEAEDKKEIINLNELGKYGFTLLQRAVLGGNKETVEILIKKGANINDKGEHGITALHLAMWKDHEEIIEFLRKKNANANATCNKGYTPIAYANFKK